MAGNIKGIKIEIDGDTQPLQKALKNVNKAATDASQELKQIDKALKFDTGNVTLLTQKQEVLQKQVATTKEKLETLRQAQSQVEQQFKNGDIGADQYRSFQREVEVTQNVLKGYESKLAGVNQALAENGNATQNNKNQLKELQNEQKQLASENERVVSSFKLQESQLGANASEADKLALAEKRIGAQSDIVARQIENLEKQLALTKQEYGENSAEANKMETQLNQAKTAYSNLSQEMSKLGNAGKQASGTLSETNNLLKAELLNQFSEKLSDISQKLVDFGKSALEAFRQVDEGMDTIVTKTGAGGEALEGMQKIANDIATELPTDFSTVGNAVGEVNTQFQLTGDSLKEVSEDVIKFSEINGTDVTNATIQSKQALEAYGLSVDYLSDVLDSTTYVAQSTGVSVDDLMKKATDGAPQIKMLGLSFDEAVTLIGQLEQHGVDSSAALSGLTKAAGAYAKKGKSMTEGLKETIDSIKNSKSETEALSTAMEIFGAKKAPQMVDAIKRGAIFNDEANLNIFENEMRRYYSNIVGKLGAPVNAILKKLSSVEISCICPSHGLIWRKDIDKVIKKYQKWANIEAEEEGVVIIYGSMYGHTTEMAEILARQLDEKGIKNVQIYDSSKVDISYLFSAIWKYKGLMIGTCTHYNMAFPKIEPLLQKLENYGLKNRYLGIFGNMLWSGGGVKRVKEFADRLTGLEQIGEPIEVKGHVTPIDREKLIELANLMADKLIADR